MYDLVSTLIKALEEKETVALATITGPSDLPSHLLARKLLVRPEGPVEGGLGVPSLDERIAADCRQAMASPPPTRLVSYVLTPDEGQALGLEAGEIEVFIEAIQPPPTLLIVGAGHIAQPLSRIGKMLGFEVAVIDDRPSLVSKARFPEADRLIAGYYGEELARFPITSSTYIVLVTRGHRHDEESLRQVIHSPAAYIGMIGSRRRVGAVFQHLAEEGIPHELIDRVCSPIGLDIGAETPEEIAVSILAEVINVRRRGTRHPYSLSSKERARV